MENKKISCSSITLSNQEKESIYNERFSYDGKIKYDPNSPWAISQEKYGSIIKCLKQKNLLKSYNVIKKEIRELYSSELSRLKIEFSEWGESDSWIEWDICKQLYCFLNFKDFYNNKKYRIANPIDDNLIRQEITNRHIGWEYWLKKQYGTITRWDNNAIVKEILNDKKYRSSFNFPSETSTGNEISSWGLELLGRKIREV